jgi:hypothetical protein
LKKYLQGLMSLKSPSSYLPTLIALIVSVGVFAVIHLLGFWDVEDLFHTGYPMAARYGLSGISTNSTNQLVHSLLGVPVFDLGIIGGYRLPLADGTISTGLLWPLRNLLPVEILLAALLLTAMLFSAFAFGRFWAVATRSVSKSDWPNGVICGLCYLALCFPTFQYMLEQDWYTMAFSFNGFVIVATSLLVITITCRSSEPSAVLAKSSLRLTLVGCYFLLLGHTGLMVLYMPSMLLIAILAISSCVRARTSRLLSFKRSEWVVELLLLVGIATRAASLLTELVSEVSGRRSIGSYVWWATPTRSFADFKHFLGQLLSTELKPWIAILDPMILEQFNIDLASRMPHTAFLVVAVVAVSVFRKSSNSNRSLVLVCLGLWTANFLLMIKVVQNPVREPADYLYRDVLLTLAMMTVGLIPRTRASEKANPMSRLWQWSLPVSLMLTSVAVSASFPMFHLKEYGSSSPYALPNALQDSDPWIDAFEQAAGTTHGVIAVIDPRFLSRWSDDSITDRRARDWLGLRGFYEFREAGFTTLEGSPKIRDASAFTGLTDSLKQVLDPPTSDFCGSGLLSFLRVTTIIMSTESRDQCYLRATNKSGNITLRASEPAPLADSGMLISNLSQQQLFRTDSNSTDNGGIRCGLLADPACFEKLGLLPSNQWQATARNCSLPCVFQMTRTTNTTNEQGMIVLPFNIGNALRVTDQTGTTIPSTSYNGMIAIPANTPGNTITITVGTDWRMWLQVITAYLQYAVLIPPLITATQRATKRKSRMM